MTIQGGHAWSIPLLILITYEAGGGLVTGRNAETWRLKIIDMRRGPPVEAGSKFLQEDAYHLLLVVLMPKFSDNGQ